MIDRRHAIIACAEHRCAARIDDVIRMRRKFDGIVEPEAQTAIDGTRGHANTRRLTGV